MTVVHLCAGAALAQALCLAPGGVGYSVCTGCHSNGRDFVRIPFPVQ